MTIEPIFPEPEDLGNGVLKLTFASADPAEQERAFDYWLGWFGLEETAQPFEVNGKVWLVRKT